MVLPEIQRKNAVPDTKGPDPNQVPKSRCSEPEGEINQLTSTGVLP